MRKKVLGILGALALCTILTGCNSIQSYSIRSYQGPLPMSDYNQINPEAYRVPMAVQ